MGTSIPASTPLTPERVRTAASIYLLIRTELMKFDGVTEDFARERAESARESYVQQCVMGRIR